MVFTSQLLANVQTVSRQELEGNTDESVYETSSEDEWTFVGSKLPNKHSRRVSTALRSSFFSSSVESEVSMSFSSSALKVPMRNNQGLLLIFQSDMSRIVWEPLLQKTQDESDSVARSGLLSAYIMEYIKNLRRNNVPIEQTTYV